MNDVNGREPTVLLATVAHVRSDGRVRLTGGRFAGSGMYYAVAAPVTLRAGDRVAVQPTGGSHMITGKVEL